MSGDLYILSARTSVPGKRKHQEDRIMIWHEIDMAWLADFDGHGGKEAA